MAMIVLDPGSSGLAVGARSLLPRSNVISPGTSTFERDLTRYFLDGVAAAIRVAGSTKT
ncbi:hypothetical protein ACFQZ8_06280 [Micromonospora azadirachtae]|uniref:Uncharacterized protein n=1 Tax=Micromonospora azadirachtae TaxID=1970735 RepID=A0ABW2ZY10_9ACTN